MYFINNTFPRAKTAFVVALALAATATLVPPPAEAHWCNTLDDQTSCDGTDCPPDGFHEHTSRYTGLRTYSCRTEPWRSWCENPDNWGVHLYGPGGGLVLALGFDGSIPPCPYGDTTWDGHYEYAFGGAWLQAAASVCTDAYPDHTPGSLISVSDVVLDLTFSDISFSVYADTLNNNPLPEDPNCGDWESDYGVDCVNFCAPGFPPGLDGTYQVYVSATYGVVSN